MRILVANYLDNRLAQLARYRDFLPHARGIMCILTYEDYYNIGSVDPALRLAFPVCLRGCLFHRPVCGYKWGFGQLELSRKEMFQCLILIKIETDERPFHFPRSPLWFAFRMEIAFSTTVERCFFIQSYRSLLLRPAGS